MKNTAPMHITSSNNPIIKQFIKLHQAKHRKETGMCLVETLHPVEEALQANLEIVVLAIQSEKTQYIHIGDIDTSTVKQVVLLPEALMKKISTTSSAPEVMAIVKIPVVKKIPVENKTVLLWELQDPGNVGTLIRSATAFGFSTIISVGGVELYSPKVIRASAGQIFRCMAIQVSELSEAMDEAQIKKNTWYGLDAHGGSHYKTLSPQEPYGIILGSEGHGLPSNTPLKIEAVHIPMTNNVESLNVGIAGSILLSQLFN